MPFGRGRTRGVVVGRRSRRRRTGSTRCRSRRSCDELPPALVDLALWLAEYYGSTPARALELVAPVRPARRKEQAPPGERQSLEGEAAAGAAERRRRWPRCRRIVGALDAGGGHFLLYGADRQRQDRGLPPGRGGGARARARDDRARPRDRARAADGRPLPRPLRRPRRDPALGADRRRAPRRARADRERRGARRRRRALGDLRADARPRPDLRRRGARPVVQAGVRSALRRAHGRGQAGGARGRGRRLRQRDAAARELGAARAARAAASGSARSCRRCASSTCAARPATRSRRRCSPSSGGSRRAAARRSCCSTAAGSRRRSTAAPAATTFRCPNCDVALVLHRDERLHCHHCGHVEPAPRGLPGLRLDRARPDRRGHAAARAGARRARFPSSS